MGHSDLVQYLQSLLIGQLNQGQFHIVISNFGLGIIPGKRATVRSPDLCVFDREEWVAGRKATPDSYIWAAPKLIVECLSPSNRKGSQFALLDDYNRLKNAEVWFIDPQKQRIDQYHFEEDQLRLVQTISAGVLHSLNVPAEIPVEDLWRAFQGA